MWQLKCVISSLKPQKKKKQSKLKTRQYVDMQQFLEANRPQGHFSKKNKKRVFR